MTLYSEVHLFLQIQVTRLASTQIYHKVMYYEKLITDLSLVFDDNGLQTLVGWDGDWLDKSEHGLLSGLLVVSLSGDSQSHFVLDTLDTSLPQVCVQLRVQSDVGGTHVLGGELSDLLDSLWGSLFEVNTVQLVWLV